jgi:hypothetical protein
MVVGTEGAAGVASDRVLPARHLAGAVPGAVVMEDVVTERTEATESTGVSSVGHRTRRTRVRCVFGGLPCLVC